MALSSNFTGVALGTVHDVATLFVDGVTTPPSAVSKISVTLLRNGKFRTADVNDVTASSWQAAFGEQSEDPFREDDEVFVFGVAAVRDAPGEPLVWHDSFMLVPRR